MLVRVSRASPVHDTGKAGSQKNEPVRPLLKDRTASSWRVAAAVRHRNTRAGTRLICLITRHTLHPPICPSVSTFRLSISSRSPLRSGPGLSQVPRTPDFAHSPPVPPGAPFGFLSWFRLNAASTTSPVVSSSAFSPLGARGAAPLGRPSAFSAPIQSSEFHVHPSEFAPFHHSIGAFLRTRKRPKRPAAKTASPMSPPRHCHHVDPA